MLILTRRENDCVLFPDLGITVEVAKLSRSRATLAIGAPRGVRVLRHELLEERPLEPAKPPLSKLNPDVERQVEEATRRLEDAMELLKVGSAEEAYDSIAVALSELDVLSKSAKETEAVSSSGSGTETWAVSDTVAEPTTCYSVSGASTELSLTVRLAENCDGEPNGFLVDRLRGLGYQVVYD